MSGTRPLDGVAWITAVEKACGTSDCCTVTGIAPIPLVTVRDMVRAQARLIDHLGIDQLFAVIGGSMGGMQVLEWAANYKNRVYTALPIATAPHEEAGARLALGTPGRVLALWEGGSAHALSVDGLATEGSVRQVEHQNVGRPRAQRPHPGT